MNINFKLPALLVLTGALSLDVFAQALDNPAFVDGELVIQLKQNASDEHLQNAFSRANIHAVQGLSIAQGNGSAVILAFTKAPVEQAVRALARHPAVDFAEPNWVYQHSAFPDDTYFVNLWGMGGNFGSQVSTAWQNGHTGSASVFVGVIDEGIDTSHPDLLGQVSPDHGWDFHHNDSSVYDGGDQDGCTDDHGTHVAGTIGAKGNNGLGVVGMNWNVTLISAKFLGPRGGTLANAVKAVDYFTGLKQYQNVNVVALNNSWGGGGYSQALHDAIIRAAKQGILFIAAAGNGKANNDRRASYPANYSTLVGTSTESAATYDSVIAVAAIDSKGNKPSWSNYGATTVDLGAPGVSILSTIPGGAYAYYSGTSMATPHVTGAVALHAATQTTAIASDRRAAVLNAAQATPTTSMTGKTVTGGRLNASGF